LHKASIHYNEPDLESQRR